MALLCRELNDKESSEGEKDGEIGGGEKLSKHRVFKFKEEGGAQVSRVEGNCGNWEAMMIVSYKEETMIVSCHFFDCLMGERRKKSGNPKT